MVTEEIQLSEGDSNNLNRAFKDLYNRYQNIRLLAYSVLPLVLAHENDGDD
jgi:hypothetical protein